MKKYVRVKRAVELDVVLPVYNEADSIKDVISSWAKGLGMHARFRLIVCEDGSTDGTAHILKTLTAKYPITLNQKAYRRGYGRAMLDGIREAKARYVLCIDSDGQCAPGDFGKFWQKRTEGILIGRRIQRADASQRKFFSKLFGAVFKVLFPTPIHDPSAPFVLFTRITILPYLPDLSYMKEGFWWGFVGMCVKRNLDITEIPIHHRHRLSGETNVYHPSKLPSIALRNILGLFRLRFSR